MSAPQEENEHAPTYTTVLSKRFGWYGTLSKQSDSGDYDFHETRSCESEELAVEIVKTWSRKLYGRLPVLERE